MGILNAIRKFLGRYADEILIGFIVLLVCVFVWRSSSWLFDFISGENVDVSDELTPPSQSSLSFERPYYKSLADRLEERMRAPIWFWSDISDIHEVFAQMNSKADLDQLIISFGTRSMGPAWMGYVEKNLVKWLVHNLNADQLKPIKEKFQSLNVPF